MAADCNKPGYRWNSKHPRTDDLTDVIASSLSGVFQKVHDTRFPKIIRQIRQNKTKDLPNNIDKLLNLRYFADCNVFQKLNSLKFKVHSGEQKNIYSIYIYI